MTLTEMAERISAHLKRFEADPEINKAKFIDTTRGRVLGLKPYYLARAWRGGRYVMVKYVDFQGEVSLTRERAERYLAWLDAGNVGTVWRSERA